jgi:hypothetical protein
LRTDEPADDCPDDAQGDSQENPARSRPLGFRHKGFLSDHDAVLPEQTADTQGFAHTLPHAMVIPGDVLFEHRTVQGLDLVHGLDEAAAQQLCQLLRVEVVILVSFLGDQTIASRLADDHALHSLM